MKPKTPRARLVYASDTGRVADFGQPASGPSSTPGDGVVRVRREIAGRRGKPVTTIRGLPSAGAELTRLAGELKRLCGAGGTATINPVSTTSGGGNASAMVSASGGNGGAGNDGADGGAGADSSLVDRLTASTDGNATWTQSAVPMMKISTGIMPLPIAAKPSVGKDTYGCPMQRE